MSNSWNKVQLIGHLGRDTENRTAHREPAEAGAGGEAGGAGDLDDDEISY